MNRRSIDKTKPELRLVRGGLHHRDRAEEKQDGVHETGTQIIILQEDKYRGSSKKARKGDTEYQPKLKTENGKAALGESKSDEG